MKKRLALVAVLAVAAIPVSASAQTWLSDRRLREGVGIRVGDLELHPALGGDFGYDNNYFQRAESENPAAAYRLRITPAFSVKTLGAQRRGANQTTPPSISFEAAAHATYHALFAADSNGEDEFSGDNSQNHIDGGASLSLKIAPQRPIGADIGVDFQHVGEPSNSPEEQAAFDRGSVRVGPGVTWRPGGGLFEWRLGYDLLYNYFMKENFANFENLQHSVVTRGRWRFLPRTALLYDGAYRFIRYTHDGAPSDGDVVRSRVGLNGLVTPRIGLLGLVGWNATFYDGAPRNSDRLIAQVEAKYFVIAPPGLEAPGVAPSASTGLSTIALGYVRDVGNSYLNSFYQKDRGYLSAVYFLGGAFAASAEGGFSHVSFPRGATVQAFTQNRIDARVLAEYRFSDSLGVNGSVLFDKNMSETLQPQPQEDLDFTRWQAYLGVRWFM